MPKLLRSPTPQLSKTLHRPDPVRQAVKELCVPRLPAVQVTTQLLNGIADVIQRVAQDVLSWGGGAYREWPVALNCRTRTLGATESAGLDQTRSDTAFSGYGWTTCIAVEACMIDCKLHLCYFFKPTDASGHETTTTLSSAGTLSYAEVAMIDNARNVEEFRQIIPRSSTR